MPHQHDWPITAAAGGNARRHAIAKNLVGKGFAGYAGRIEKRPQPIAEGINAALVVAARVNIYEVSQHADHGLMLPTEMIDNIGLCFR